MKKVKNNMLKHILIVKTYLIEITKNTHDKYENIYVCRKCSQIDV